MRRVALAAVFGVLSALRAGADVPVEDPVLYRHTGPDTGRPAGVLADGRTGAIADFQHAVNLILLACGEDLRLEPDGRFGVQTRTAIALAATCPPIAARLPEGSAAHEGAITQAFWELLLPDRPVPDARTRARALLLAFEGTEIASPAEWNFCQNNSEIYDPLAEDPTCYTNDRASYLTWGPNGATAGHGHEILAILARVERLDRALVDTAFGAEAGALRRMFDLQITPESDDELRRYLCGIYVDFPRRQAWSQGFAALGSRAEVRAIYAALYESASFDGGKIRTFMDAWRDAGLEPTEIDFAFFADRAAHTRVRNVEVRRILRRVLSAGDALTPAEIRRRFSRLARVSNLSQRGPRLGRDVAFFVDAFEPVLSRAERHNWRSRGARRAAAAGLSDERPAPPFVAGPRDDWQATGLRPLTPDEAALCPAPVLNPRRPA
ncbi:hypothetical protein [Pararhodobacter zhoushanensis]|uniref:S-layer homology domain-containing protein n=1 Tax=Pararhodobacter zhoushanensis TaxID=2479545 RepID=A0ABT3GW02_9RHOB|nr:hypothetical protein [Pararhodobacter zhoushanensis]MCW1931715.1 hypothetical protein [Pararhodobacter zhoushanensis]